MLFIGTGGYLLELGTLYWNWGSLLEPGGYFWDDRCEGCAAICSLGRCSQNLIPSHLHGLTGSMMRIWPPPMGARLILLPGALQLYIETGRIMFSGRHKSLGMKR